MEADPPKGTVTFASTDIEGSTEISRRLKGAWSAVKRLHDQTVHNLIREYKCYEAQNKGDGFIVAFDGAQVALAWAIELQLRLHNLDWPDIVLQDPKGKPITDGMFRGLRVRIGLHTGEPSLEVDTTTGRVKYSDTVMSTLARVEAAGHGGQILISNTTKVLLDNNPDPGLPQPVIFTNMGEHRLKGIEIPVQLWQVLPEKLRERVFPPLRTLDPKSTNLPTELDSIVGREDALETISTLVLQQDHPLVTLTGPPGIGKTRLSKCFGGRHLADFPGGVWFADGTEARTLGGVCHAVSMALGVSLTQADSMEQLGAALYGRCQNRGKLLLIFDNAEQVVDETAQAMAKWLRMAPQARLLVTSRERLNITGEQTLPIAPLGYPEKGKGPFVSRGTARHESFASVKLFIDRARRVNSTFTLDEDAQVAIGDICRALDGIPLAIELAAARVSSMTPQMIVQLLPKRFDLLAGRRRDASARHLTLWDAIEWSWDLLTPWEQSALSQCGVFAGGFLLGAAEDVIDLSSFEDAPSAVDVVEALTEMSLLQAVPSPSPFGVYRYKMYESIRDFALCKLAEKSLGSSERTDRIRATSQGGSSSVPYRHAMHYLRYATFWNPRINGPEAVEALDRLQSEFENLLAVQSAFEATDPELAASAALSVAEPMKVRGPWEKRLPSLHRALKAANQLSPPLQVSLLCAVAYASFDVGNTDDVDLHSASAMVRATKYLQSNDGVLSRKLLADATMSRQLLFRLKGDKPSSEMRLLESALALYESIREAASVARCIRYQGELHRQCGEYSEALGCFSRAHSYHSRVGDLRGMADSESGEAAVQMYLCEVLVDPSERRSAGVKARELFELARGRYEAMSCLAEVANVENGLGETLRLLRLHSDANLCYMRAERINREIGNRHGVAVNLGNRGAMWLGKYIGEPGTLSNGAKWLERARADLRECLSLRRELRQEKKRGYAEHLSAYARVLWELAVSGDRSNMTTAMQEAIKTANEVRALFERLNAEHPQAVMDSGDARQWLAPIPLA